MRGHIKLFTLPLDLNLAHQYCTMVSEVSRPSQSPQNVATYSIRMNVLPQVD